ncbi:hypothetical protein F5B18DRAFT_598039 [Nemania serpens]|nr:hypothetical protein F5B18DRAFT_598039 [Nemania serpens]
MRYNKETRAYLVILTQSEISIMPLPPPPPPPPTKAELPAPAARPQAPQPPSISATRPSGAFKLELLIFNGWPFKDHWAFWVPTASNPDIGTQVHAVGDVRNGFEFQIKRNRNFEVTTSRPTERIPLQWVNGRFFDEKAMLNNGAFKLDDTPVCGFEASVHKVKAPTKSLNAVDDPATRGRPVNQRNCQTWIVEAAAQLVRDGIINHEVSVYLNTIKQ